MSVRFRVLSGFAFRALRANKMRSFLTMLGIIIGVGSVIIMISLGEGMQEQVMSRFSAMGTNILTVSQGGERSQGGKTTGKISPLTLQDAEAIAGLPGVVQVSPMVRGSLQAIHGGSDWTTSITGTGSSYLDMSSMTIKQGRFFNEGEVDGSVAVAVLGPTAYENLFGAGVNPVGKTIRIQGVSFQVAGLLNPLASSGEISDSDNVIYIPVTTAQTRLLGTSNQGVDSIQIQVQDSGQINALEEQVASLLRSRHRLADNADDDFRIRNMAQMLAEAQEVTNALTLFLAGIAAISLIVGGIGIMNIMLVSVTERTREIGVRMAVGANRLDILAQFLYEAILLSLAGCFIGMALGFSGGQIFAQISGYSIPLSWDAVAMAVGFSSLVGIVFGYYPAHRAARMNPAEALSWE